VGVVYADMSASMHDVSVKGGRAIVCAAAVTCRCAEVCDLEGRVRCPQGDRTTVPRYTLQAGSDSRDTVYCCLLI
jgi:hypothetical protein